MKKFIYTVLSILIFILCLTGCSNREKAILDPNNPVTLTMWHVYGSQADSPMIDIIAEFNDTVGKEKGIIINVTSVSNSSSIDEALIASAEGRPGSGELPDIFFCYPRTAMSMGADLLIDWNDYYSDEELENYVDSFIEEGIIDDRLIVFPTAKTTEMLFVNESLFDRFAEETGVSYTDLETFEGFFDVSKKYFEWSGGEKFFMLDDIFNYCMINTVSLGDDFFDGDNINYSSDEFRKVWSFYADAAINGEAAFSDNYSTTAMMTGDVVCGIGSTASILYFKDTVTYSDNTVEPLNLKFLPTPSFENSEKTAIQRGVGICALKSTKEKELAASIFCKWFTDSENNLKFVTRMGYLPVTKEAFNKLFDGTFDGYCDEKYKRHYETIERIFEEYRFFIPPNFEDYGDYVRKFEKSSRAVFAQLREADDEERSAQKAFDMLFDKMISEN